MSALLVALLDFLIDLSLTAFTLNYYICLNNRYFGITNDGLVTIVFGLYGRLL